MTMRILAQRIRTGVRVGWLVYRYANGDASGAVFIDLARLGLMRHGRLALQLCLVGWTPGVAVAMTWRDGFSSFGMGPAGVSDVWRCGPLYVARGSTVTR